MSRVSERDRDGGDQRERPGDQAEGNGGEQLPVLELERRQRVDPDERRPRDRKVHRERDRGGQQTSRPAFTEKRAAFGRASSSTRIVAKIGDDNRPPYAADIPLSVFVARISSLSFVRSETQVPSPPPIFPSASSGPRLAPPASDTSETATAFRTVEGSTRWSFSSWTVPGILAGSRSTPPKHADEHPGARGHRHPPKTPVQPAGVLRKREPEIGPALDQPQERQAANASTTPNNAAYPISRQNPGDRVNATTSEPGCDPSPEPGRGPALTNGRSSLGPRNRRSHEPG